MENKGYQLLAARIVGLAAEEYKAAYEGLVKRPTSAQLRAKIRNCEKFFASEWCDCLMEMDGKVFLRKLKNLCRETYGEIKEIKYEQKTNVKKCA